MDQSIICDHPTMLGEVTPMPIPDGISTVQGLRPGDLTPQIACRMHLAQLRELFLIRSMQAGRARREKDRAIKEGGWEGLVAHWRSSTTDQTSILDYEGDRFILSAEMGRRRGS